MSRWMLVRCVLAGVGVGAVTWLFGVQGARPILLGACTTAVVMAVVTAPVGHHPRWPHQPGAARGGGSTQVWRLANRITSLVTRAGGADAAMQHRLRRLAIARLHRHGIAWDDPRAADALGASVYRALTEPHFRPDMDELEHIVTAIERVDTTATGGNVP